MLAISADHGAEHDMRLLHGTGTLVCDCWRCTEHRPWPRSTRLYVPKWHVGPLLALGVGTDDIRRAFGTERLIAWRNSGLPDHEADLAAVALARYHPAVVWRGWYAAVAHYWPDGGETDAGNGTEPEDARRPR